MLFKKVGLISMLLGLAASPAAQAINLTFQGNFSNDNDLLLFNFSVADLTTYQFLITGQTR